jgi:hypothetical protein
MPCRYVVQPRYDNLFEMMLVLEKLGCSSYDHHIKSCHIIAMIDVLSHSNAVTTCRTI